MPEIDSKVKVTFLKCEPRLPASSVITFQFEALVISLSGKVNLGVFMEYSPALKGLRKGVKISATVHIL